MIDEVLQHQHPLWVDVVEGDGEVTTAVHALMFPVLDILNMRTRNYILLYFIQGVPKKMRISVLGPF